MTCSALSGAGLIRKRLHGIERRPERRSPNSATSMSPRARSGQILTKFDTPKKVSTLATDEGRILRHIKRCSGRGGYGTSKPRTSKILLHAVASGKTAADEKTGKHGRAIVKGGRGTATRTVGLLGGIFTFAVKKGLRPDNPAKGIQRYKDGRNTRYLSGPSYSALGRLSTPTRQPGKNSPRRRRSGSPPVTKARPHGRRRVRRARWRRVRSASSCSPERGGPR